MQIIKTDAAISLKEYQELVTQATTTGLKIPRCLIADYQNASCRSMLGRYFSRIEQDFHNAARVISTVISNQICEEEQAWCHLDFAVSQYNCGGEAGKPIAIVQKVREWVMQHEDELLFLSLAKIDEVIQLMENVIRHNNESEGVN